MAKNAPSTANASSEVGSATTMQDILILLLPYLPKKDAKTLFEFCLTPEVLSGKDNGVQKRGYKILVKLLENEKVEMDMLVLLQKLDELVEGLTPAAKKVSFLLFCLCCC
jgi:ribosomal RNA-processing protein 12